VWSKLWYINSGHRVNCALRNGFSVLHTYTSRWEGAHIVLLCVYVCVCVCITHTYTQTDTHITNECVYFDRPSLTAASTRPLNNITKQREKENHLFFSLSSYAIWFSLFCFQFIVLRTFEACLKGSQHTHIRCSSNMHARIVWATRTKAMKWWWW
jgi:hypothetical protein